MKGFKIKSGKRAMKKDFSLCMGRRAIEVVFLLLASVFIALAFTSCADANGLHNQEAAQLTFVFTNFPVEDGSYSIPGDHNSWDNSTETISIKDGEGKSSAVKVTSTSIEFTLVKKDNWIRPWAKDDGGKIEGSGRIGKDIKRNFLIEDLDLSSEITVTIDGSTPVATVYAK